MSLRDAFQQSQFLTLLVIGVLAWTAFSITRVLSQFDYWAPEAVGMTPASGIIGVVVMLVGATLLLALLGAFGHNDPTADTWPPEDVAGQDTAAESWDSYEQQESTSEPLTSEETTAE